MDQFDLAFQRAQTIYKYLKNELNEEERHELEVWIAANEDNRRLFEQLINERELQEELKFFESIELQNAWQKITAQTEGEGKVVALHAKKRRWRYAAAAAVILLIGSVVVYQLSVSKPSSTDIAKKEAKYKDDVLPGGNKAVLTLADGSTIILDDAQNGALAQQGNTKVTKLGGKLAYDPANADSKEVLYNTIATPRGGQYQVELPDGSQVWLNAASSLRFPTAFEGKVRRVEITGEAYFEVAKNKSMPFVVSVNGAEVKVLGTHFNVMAYGEENAVRTTLLEGSVQFVSGNNTSLLQPGQQSQLTKEGEVKVVNGVDVESIIAWKNGMFHFENADIETVMRQLARWYDVEVDFKGQQIDNLFYAKIPRSSKLSDVLKVLELTGNIKFKIEGKKITVRQ
jgi:transmembrane sensor